MHNQRGCTTGIVAGRRTHLSCHGRHLSQLIWRPALGKVTVSREGGEGASIERILLQCRELDRYAPRVHYRSCRPYPGEQLGGEDILSQWVAVPHSYVNFGLIGRRARIGGIYAPGGSTCLWLRPRFPAGRRSPLSACHRNIAYQCDARSLPAARVRPTSLRTAHFVQPCRKAAAWHNFKFNATLTARSASAWFWIGGLRSSTDREVTG